MSVSQHTTKRTTKSGRKESFEEKLFWKAMREKAPVISEEQLDGIERKIRMDAYRRIALVFLSKSFKEMTEKIATDRKGAVAFADAMHGAHDAAERYKDLSELLETASVRIRMALCVREDMDSVLAEGKPDWVKAA